MSFQCLILHYCGLVINCTAVELSSQCLSTEYARSQNPNAYACKCIEAFLEGRIQEGHSIFRIPWAALLLVFLALLSILSLFLEEEDYTSSFISWD